MSIKNINEKPKITDTVIIPIKTPVDECFLANPYKVDNIKIYFVSKNFTLSQDKIFEKKVYNEDKLKDAEEAEKLACLSPTDEALEETAIRLRRQAEETVTINKFFFDQAENVVKIGSDEQPAWLSSQDDSENLISKIDEDEDGNEIFGSFEVAWTPKFAREGDYFVCWTWTPHVAGQNLTDFLHFSLYGDTGVTTSIPTHRTNPDKYNTLIERYTPQMYKIKLCETDLTPFTIDRLNKSVADGFEFIENFANQTIDLLDSNATHESLLSLVSNFFNLKLRSTDPTLWRRQIKNAVPLFKKKGTRVGLTEALAQAGIILTKCTSLWQIVSPSTYTESFVVSEGQTTFSLTQVPIDPYLTDLDNFELEILLSDTSDFITLTSDFVTISADGTMTWIGNQLSVSPIILEDGDIIKVIYKIAPVENQLIENYIRNLDLMDQRDVRIEYPPKNWNVHVIEEDDILFDTLIPSKHPFAEPIIWGQIRTEFPYSENIYNMEEYNGSKRDSTDPCHIGKEFVDFCSACRSSKINVDVEIENITDDRIIEAQEIIQEFVPFHTRLHKLLISAAVNEYIASPEENLEILLRWRINENVISGNAQTIFSRSMDNPHDPDYQILRNELASQTSVTSVVGETAANIDIVLYTDETTFNRHILDVDYNVPAVGKHPPQINHNVLEILAPHPHSGVYFDALSEPGRNLIKISGISEPITTSSFTFRVSNVIYDIASSAALEKDNLYFLEDENVDFSTVTTNNTIHIPAYSGTPFEIIDIHPGEKIVFVDHTPGTLPSNGATISYNLLDGVTTVATSTTGALSVTLRARVELTDARIGDIREFVKRGDYLAYPVATSPLPQYEVIGFVNGETHQFYVRSDVVLDALLAPSVGGVNISVLRRYTANITGNLTYRGHKLTTTIDYESSLGIVNGENPPVIISDENKFVESFLIAVTTDPGGLNESEDYYAISEWNGTEIVLDGPLNSWTLAGSNVDIIIYQFEKTENVEIQASPEYASQPGHIFTILDRRGQDVIDVTTTMVAPYTSMSTLANELNCGKSQTTDKVTQGEDISMTINYLDKED